MNFQVSHKEGNFLTISFSRRTLSMALIRWEVVEWIYLAQDRDQWRDLVKTVMSLRVP
jgi:hypothetical protein